MLGRFITFGERAAGDTALACAPAGPPAEMAASAPPRLPTPTALPRRTWHESKQMA